MLAVAEQYDAAYRSLCELTVVNDDLVEAVRAIFSFVQRVSEKGIRVILLMGLILTLIFYS